MPVVLAADVGATWWEYAVLFLAVAASFAGVPAIGTTALAAAAVGASQGNLDLAAVILVSIAGAEVGGLIGYTVGYRWGRQLVQRPGKHQAGRQKMLDRGERVYARWGPLAVFVTPSIVSGTAKMRFKRFAVWNLVDGIAFSIAVAASAYGLGRLLTGGRSLFDVATLLVGLAVGGAIILVVVQRHRRGSRTATP
jgi:membrane protein DedA with SNARE-associated domain